MSNPYSEAIQGLPSMAPEPYCRPSTVRSLKKIRKYVSKKHYADTQIELFRSKIKKMESQIEVLESRKMMYDNSIIEEKKIAKRCLDRDLGDYLDSQ